jgi:hypothetical protein
VAEPGRHRHGPDPLLERSRPRDSHRHPAAVPLALLFGVGGLCIAIEDTLERAIAANLLPEDLRSTGYGVLATANGIGDLISSLVVGVPWTAVGPTAGFAYAVGLSVVGATIVYRVR